MSWTYRQSTGELMHAGELVGAGYSGRAEGRNNPALQAVHNVGPIPQGLYGIGPEFDAPAQGPVTMTLTPEGHDALGRSGFLIHGDNPTHDASTGCIIMPHDVRELIAVSLDRQLEVIE